MTGDVAGAEDTGIPSSCEHLPQGRAQGKGSAESVEREGWQETEREAGKEEEEAGGAFGRSLRSCTGRTSGGITSGLT